MSLLSTFEDRMSRIFEGSGRDASSPIPFKRFGKLAAKEMKKNVLVMDGRDFAPNLYTFLIGQRDNAALAPLYPELTAEIEAFIKSSASGRKLSLVTDPLVRFIMDPDLKSGSVSLVAESVTPSVMKDLEREERVFYGLDRGNGGGRQSAVEPVPMPMPASNGMLGVVPFSSAPAYDDDVMGVAPVYMDDIPAVAPPVAAQRSATTQGPVLLNRNTGESFRLSPPSVIIGRDERTADIVLQDSNVSRSHANVTYESGSWIIRDLNSTNGTRVNGSGTKEYRLRHGDTIEIGVIVLIFQEA